tara:strand:+ start:235 stop:804 length:570 start_codon:yes stop_codon:yes gene_type:complete
VKIFIPFILMLALTSCTSQPTYLPINPHVNISASNIGKHQNLGFTVSDKRLSNQMSDNNTSATLKTLQTSDDIVNKIAQQVNQLIASHNFIPAGYNIQHQRNLKTELLSIDIGEKYNNKQHMYYIQIALMADASNGEKHYRYIYRGVGDSPTTWNGYSKAAMTKDINAAYTQALMTMGNDKKLWQFLAN